MSVLILLFHVICLIIVVSAGIVAIKEFKKPMNKRNQRKIDSILVLVLIVALVAILSSVFTDI
ncbi:hypothetical protein BUZ61_00360 [Staphylococcus nepalensis]|uniref:Uncharacterized protein n=1 Tax=Staphylococcus nepalensis TaxID=214473 RepID=A0A291JN54_9STAP|nr:MULTISPECIES: hypothetical protein [Staphylococcus]ATH61172.1 hypothetical protein BJD96_13190 [Staphylococcus nepalensis]ATH66203.1 hypothetical protein BJG89_13200 [Staphylococcus nepalensis]AWI45591.1 hypothetical protein BJG88_13080 [Staphylococcus nepalensis]MBO1221803.1 hypothetical protein [Staphylococcus nepalensis]MDW8553027.1 hypothetical protein [Staphylococcus nepalensis]